MAQRPLLKCLQCHHTWYPRGSNRSVKCPSCGVKFTYWEEHGASEEPEARRFGPGAIGLLVVLAAVGAVAVIAVANKNLPAPSAAPAEHPDAPKQVARKPEPVGQGKPTAEDRGPTPTKRNPESVPPRPPEPDPVQVAPPPRGVEYSAPPRGRLNPTEWVRLGSIETRVTGAVVGPAPLQDRAGNQFNTPDPVLRVWVETRAVAPPKNQLRRWASTLDPARLSGPPGKPIPKSRAATGATVLGELVGGKALVPGGEAVPDVLLFEVPPPSASELVLTLDGEHLNETGQARHVIRAESWK